MTSADGDNLTPFVVQRKAAARLLGIGCRTFDRWLAAGLVGPQPFKRGGLLLFRVRELEAWVDAGMPERAAWAAMTEAACNRRPGAA